MQHDRIGVAQEVNGQLRPIMNANSMNSLIERWAIGRFAPYISNSRLPLASVDLLPPIMPIRNLFCVGWNYQSHFDEGIEKAARAVKQSPDHPAFFSKATATINSRYGFIPLHQVTTEKLDWEVELAVIIGRGGRSIPEALALDHVFGYCVANDVSARDLQQRHGGQSFKGKCLDETCPLGPVIVTADEIPDPQTLAIRCRVNGVVKQQSNTRHQVFSVARVTADLSVGMTLLSGDVILTGTPEGVGYARNPPEYLRADDILESEIARFGILRNRISASGNGRSFAENRAYHSEHRC
jgi:2-keto-4-pentenoate hydratase/2-oxohepta-3-ene-1,7-dioic acid hydratase in catechol pathway